MRCKLKFARTLHKFLIEIGGHLKEGAGTMNVCHHVFSEGQCLHMVITSQKNCLKIEGKMWETMVFGV